MHKIFFINFKFATLVLVLFACFFMAKNAHASGYYSVGTVKSNNILSGAEITDINEFRVSASVPASTTVQISFSQDRDLYYSASGTKGAWTDCATGTTIIDLSGLHWTGALLFYKLKLITTDASTTPVVGEVRVDYDGSNVPAATSTQYSARGIVLSENLLSGATVSAITGFLATTTVPVGSAAMVSFSQDNSSFYSASGTKGAWTALDNGGNSIDLSALSWSNPSFYYKVRLDALIDPAVLPKLSEASLIYTGSVATASSSDYDWSGAFVSSDLFASTTDPWFIFDRFGYNISYLPFDATVKAQFSADGEHWFSSTGTPWSYDSLSQGENLNPPFSINLANIGWEATSSFYFKLKYELGLENNYSPIVNDIHLYYHQPPNFIMEGDVIFEGTAIFDMAN